MALFTPEELAELERVDAEIEDGFRLTDEDLRRSRRLDREATLESKANKEKIAAKQAAYREANKEKIAAKQAAYYEANKEKIADYQAAYYEANKEKIRAYAREYMRKRRAAAKQKNAAPGVAVREAALGN